MLQREVFFLAQDEKEQLDEILPPSCLSWGSQNRFGDRFALCQGISESRKQGSGCAPGSVFVSLTAKTELVPQSSEDTCCSGTWWGLQAWPRWGGPPEGRQGCRHRPALPPALQMGSGGWPEPQARNSMYSIELYYPNWVFMLRWSHCWEIRLKSSQDSQAGQNTPCNGF